MTDRYKSEIRKNIYCIFEKRQSIQSFTSFFNLYNYINNMKVLKDAIVNCKYYNFKPISNSERKGRFNSRLEESFRAKIFERSKVPSWLRNHSNDVERIPFHFDLFDATVGNGKEQDTLFIVSFICLVQWWTSNRSTLNSLYTLLGWMEKRAGKFNESCEMETWWNDSTTSQFRWLMEI